MQTVLLLGATGLVGRAALDLIMVDPRVDRVVAPTRRPLPAHPRLRNPIVDFDALDPDSPDWQVDAVVCALGTTIRDAGSRAAFRRVDFEYPLAFARLAQAQGARAFALTSAMGAHPRSLVFYSRTKGQLEDALRALDFPSLTLIRPGLLDGPRAQHRPMEQLALRVSRGLRPVLPAAWRAVPAEAVARTLLESAIEAPPGVRVIESARIGV